MRSWLRRAGAFEHLGVAVVAAPLIAFGLVQLASRRLEHRARVPMLDAVLASAIEMIVVWGWHVPAAHEAAMLSDPIFAAQQLSFLLAGHVLWGTALSARDPASIGIGALALLFTFMHRRCSACSSRWRQS